MEYHGIPRDDYPLSSRLRSPAPRRVELNRQVSPWLITYLIIRSKTDAARRGWKPMVRNRCRRISISKPRHYTLFDVSTYPPAWLPNSRNTNSSTCQLARNYLHRELDEGMTASSGLIPLQITPSRHASPSFIDFNHHPWNKLFFHSRIILSSYTLTLIKNLILFSLILQFIKFHCFLKRAELLILR